MKPIKLNEFLADTASKNPRPAMNLTEFGLFHAAPVEDEQAFLHLRFDQRTGTLMPAE